MSRARLFFFFLLFAAGVSLARAEAAPTTDEVRFEQRLGAKLPLSTVLLEPDGTRHALRDYFRRRPVVLFFGYAGCPQLCSIVADGTVAALRQIRPAVGRDLEVISLSIDPNETAEAAKTRLADIVHRYGDSRSEDGWHYLRGSEASIRAIADAAGFHFVYDPRSRQYGHPSGFVVITPVGIISRYFPGVDFEASKVAPAITRAARGEIGEPVFDLLLQCFRGDGVTGRYSATIWVVLFSSATLTVLGLAGWIAWMLRAERQVLRAKVSP